METPRLYHYPFDPAVVARMRARERAREAERRARRSSHGRATGLRAFLRWVIG